MPPWRLAPPSAGLVNPARRPLQRLHKVLVMCSTIARARKQRCPPSRLWRPCARSSAAPRAIWRHRRNMQVSPRRTGCLDALCRCSQLRCRCAGHDPQRARAYAADGAAEGIGLIPGVACIHSKRGWVHLKDILQIHK